jgi:hypothetical protein
MSNSRKNSAKIFGKTKEKKKPTLNIQYDLFSFRKVSGTSNIIPVPKNSISPSVELGQQAPIPKRNIEFSKLVKLNINFERLYEVVQAKLRNDEFYDVLTFPLKDISVVREKKGLVFIYVNSSCHYA